MIRKISVLALLILFSVISFGQVAGDINEDGNVNSLDYNDFKLYLLGQFIPSPGIQTDFNSDGNTNILDADILWNHVNNTYPLSGGINSTATVNFSIGNVTGGTGPDNNTIEIIMTNSEPIGSFQFNVNFNYGYHYGGVASSFEIITGGTSFNGGYVTTFCGIAGSAGSIPAGTHVLTVLSGYGLLSSITEICITNPIVGTYGSDNITNTTNDNCKQITYGCNDPNALNYNPNAVVNDYSCQYPSGTINGGIHPYTNTYNGKDQINYSFGANENVKHYGFKIDNSIDQFEFLPFDDGTYTKDYEGDFTVTIIGDSVAVTPTTGNIAYTTSGDMYSYPQHQFRLNIKRITGTTACIKNAKYTTENDITRQIDNLGNWCNYFEGTPPLYGCTHPLASNYDTNAQINDGSCNLPAPPGSDGVNVSETNAVPHHSAVLDLSDNAGKGFLAPKMTYQQMIEIISPAEGLMVYVTDGDLPGIYYYNNFKWVNVSKTFDN